MHYNLIITTLPANFQNTVHFVLYFQFDTFLVLDHLLSSWKLTWCFATCRWKPTIFIWMNMHL